MTDEEKKATEDDIELKYVTNKEFNINECFYILKKRYFSDDTELKAINYLEQFIEKQQKEIEELKHDNSILCEIAYTGKRIQLPYTMVYTGTDNYISKDKIKEKIKELEKQEDWFIKYKTSDEIYNKIKILEELLGE